jgi:hypothetical protein
MQQEQTGALKGGGQPGRLPVAHEFRGPQTKRGNKKRGCTLRKANKIKCVLS